MRTQTMSTPRRSRALDEPLTGPGYHRHRTTFRIVNIAMTRGVVCSASDDGAQTHAHEIKEPAQRRAAAPAEERSEKSEGDTQALTGRYRPHVPVAGDLGCIERRDDGRQLIAKMADKIVDGLVGQGFDDRESYDVFDDLVRKYSDGLFPFRPKRHLGDAQGPAT
ncbi:hypothetical protein QO002_005528 [Pararhizobium capsulatum DSM 1112]|uniref:Uncharacterized protein n=1 Tax=Pararhizobium capsulatum DSM 1112 TaxID=1121113 RepID=A0ABU0BYH9_9HYPH|nr:hypothetical protein [Pararhizobium capsulatum]MDQ0323322.1 hypothetical protein [Pararhizobium capsulatum DSM 1112]